ncbi:hypothetical protein WSM22_25480 [Cytophagales bacterium WSM2-2]|nr:hypothetical protein WSM22_25480 [Cytophagales bacterium WSM2-2]
MQTHSNRIYLWLASVRLRAIMPMLALILTINQGCYHYRISSANFDPSTSYEKKTIHSFFWGLAAKRNNGIDLVTDNCDKMNINQLDEIRVTTNLGYSLINIATLGIWNPIQIQWKCAKPREREGTTDNHRKKN